MKHLSILFSIILSFLMFACSTYDEPDLIPTPQSENADCEVDTIRLPLKFNISSLSVNTRSSDNRGLTKIPNWKIIWTNQGWSDGKKNGWQFQYKDFVIKNIDYPELEIEGPKKYKLLYRIIDTKSGNTVFGKLDDVVFKTIDETQNFKSILKFTTPKGYDLSRYKCEFLLNSNQFTNYNNHFNNLSCLHNQSLSLTNMQSIKDTLYKSLGYIPELDFLQSNIINPQSKIISFYNSCKLTDSDVQISKQITLKIKDALIYVFTDEFNEYIYPFGNGSYDYNYDAFIISSWDFKSNRLFKEYWPDVENYYYKYKNGYPDIIKTYDNIINDHSNNKTYILPNKCDTDFTKSSFSTIGQLPTASWWAYGYRTNINPATSYINIYKPGSETTNNYFYQENSGRKFLIVASKLISMPYGKVQTLNYYDNNCFTHLNSSTDRNKDIKYLVLSASQRHNELSDELWGSTTYRIKEIPIYMRAAIPIPEEGFKPGHIYMIYNKPGTKLFKEWDEANATTRSGDDSEYIVDPNSIEIEEIPM